MQWSELLATLSPTTAVDLVNGLSLGYGQAALAGRRAARDARVSAVEGPLAAALVAWARSVALLPAEARAAWVPPTPPDLAAPPNLPAASWSAVLRGADVGPLDTLLGEALAAARRSAQVVLDDGPVTETLAQLALAWAAAAALHARLRALADDDAAGVPPG